MEIDSLSLLAVTHSGDLIRIYCPFPALCIKDVGIICAGDRVIVVQVLTKDNTLVFRIGVTLYYQYLFIILDH